MRQNSSLNSTLGRDVGPVKRMSFGVTDVREGSWSCKNALAVALTRRPPWRFCNSPRTDVGGSYALIAAISGLVPMMFMTRVML
jgi:hypothetical protein